MSIKLFHANLVDAVHPIESERYQDRAISRLDLNIFMLRLILRLPA